MFCWLGIWTFTDTEVLFQLLESAAPRVAYPWPSSAPWRMRERLWPRGALRPHCAGQGEPVCRRGSVSPSRGVMPSQEVVGASLPSPPPRAVLCFVCAEKTVLGLRGSVSCSGEPFAWEPGTPLLVASWHSDMQGTKRTFGKERIQSKQSARKTCMCGT